MVPELIGAAGILLTGFGLGWAVYTWRRQYLTRVRVKVSVGFPVGPMGVGPSMLIVTAYNDSPHPIPVKGVGIALEDGSKRTAPIMGRPPGAELPGVVPPRDQGMSWMGLDDFVRATGPITVRGYVDTGDGKRHLSKRQKLG